MVRAVSFAILLLLATVALGEEAPKESREADGPGAEAKTKAAKQAAEEYPLNGRFKKQWPTADDLKWFREAKGMTRACALKIYGKPVKVVRQKDGAEAWHYPWVAAAIIYVKEGRVRGVWYDAGY